MDALETIHYILIGVGVIIVGLIIGLIIVKQKPKTSSLPNVETILNSLNKKNIKAIDFQRHKLVVTVHKSKEVKLEDLKATGAVGINVVGNKVKFYYEDNNEKIYEALKAMERND